jgi:predicted ABC-type ATPase
LSENAASWPRLLIVAGPNGSGKTTLTNRLRAMGLELGEYINADEIALELPPGLERDRTAQIEAERRRALALRENRSFSFETVMSHPSKIDEMRAARTAGYNITFIGVALQNPQLNVARVALRVSEGGHDVPKDRVLGRYPRVLALMPDAISLADRSLIFDNSDSSQGPILGLVASRRMLDATLDHEAPCHRLVASAQSEADQACSALELQGLNKSECASSSPSSSPTSCRSSTARS